METADKLTLQLTGAISTAVADGLHYTLPFFTHKHKGTAGSVYLYHSICLGVHLRLLLHTLQAMPCMFGLLSRMVSCVRCPLAAEVC